MAIMLLKETGLEIRSTHGYLFRDLDEFFTPQTLLRGFLVLSLSSSRPSVMVRPDTDVALTPVGVRQPSATAPTSVSGPSSRPRRTAHGVGRANGVAASLLVFPDGRLPLHIVGMPPGVDEAVGPPTTRQPSDDGVKRPRPFLDAVGVVAEGPLKMPAHTDRRPTAVGLTPPMSPTNRRFGAADAILPVEDDETTGLLRPHSLFLPHL